MKFYDGDTILSRTETMNHLVQRDGLQCWLCKESYFTNDNPANIDHVWPLSYARSNGWRETEYNSVENIKIAHTKCNIEKGSQLPEPGWVFTKSVKSPKPVKVAKTPVCEFCWNGAALEVNGICDYCFLDNSKRRFPKVLQASARTCDHEIFYCWVCTVHPDLITTTKGV